MLLECDICTKTVHEGYGFYIEEAENGRPVAVCRYCYEVDTKEHVRDKSA